MQPTVPERVWLIPQRPIAHARLNSELTATSFHGNVEPSHAGPSPISSIAMVARPAPSIWLGGVTSVQLTLPVAPLCSQLATRPHLAVILVVPCSNLELPFRRVDKTISACVGGRPPLQSCLRSIRCTARFASTYSSSGAPLPSCYHLLATPDAVLPPRCTTAPSMRTWPAWLGSPPVEPPPRLGPW